MTLGRDELGFDELLADGLIRALMRADHVEPEALRSLASAASERLSAGRSEGAPKQRVAFGLAFDGASKTSAPSPAKPGRGFSILAP
jgi:hypothetical protein